MSVFTSVSKEELATFLTAYDVGTLVEHTGIEAGIENSNFFCTTTAGEFVLTLFERVPSEDVPYFMDLTAWLADNGVSCAHPIAGRDGSYSRVLNAKDAALVQRLRGKELTDIKPRHCHAVGVELGKLHLAGMKFKHQRENAFGISWFKNTIDLVTPKCDKDTVALMRSQFADFERISSELPTGTIHADLFTDNVLFENDELSGVIDFYYACDESLAYDLAITVNDWCKEKQGGINAQLMSSLVQGYESVRKLEDIERDAMPVMLRRAAFRFFLSRLKDKVFPREGEMVKIKDPEVFRRILTHHLNNEQSDQSDV